MMAKSWFKLFADDDNSVELGCEFILLGEKVFLVSADVYDVYGTYLANWLRRDMPFELIGRLERWLQGDPYVGSIILRRHARE